MNKKFLALFSIFLLMLPLAARADLLSKIAHTLAYIYGINVDIRKLDQSQLQSLQDIKSVNESQRDETIKLRNSLTGAHDFGRQYDDASRLSWGENSTDWQSVLALINHGGSNTELGSLVNRISQEYPVKDSLGSQNNVENNYYRMQAQTTIANRAAAELTFKQINNEADAIRKLHLLIDTTADEKSAVDLNNRLLAENAIINIQQAKLLTMLVQQQTIDSQLTSNTARANADFFDIKGKK